MCLGEVLIVLEYGESGTNWGRKAVVDVGTLRVVEELR